jgi:hypothetical protein
MNEACDRCGPAVSAGYRVVRVHRAGELYVCGQCASRHWQALSAQGWTFWPLGVHALAPQAGAAPKWQASWFKGGSEPGVLTLAFMATTRTGHSYAVTVLAENPSQPINQATAIPAILSAIQQAFTLAARAGQDTTAAIISAASGNLGPHPGPLLLHT